jgi:hypothetical protein
MEDYGKILGLFFSDENNLIYENVKYLKYLPEDKKDKLKVLPMKFLGPLFLTAASNNKQNWKIDLIESTLSLYQKREMERDVIQSFFSLNSSLRSGDGMTNLFTLIGTPYTEDIEIIYKKITEYIHPSIIQGKIVKESIMGDEFSFKNFITEELNRGLDLIENSLGASRKMYWKEQQKYSCVGLVERIISSDTKETNLLTFEEDNPLRSQLLSEIPTFYVMTIIPDFYEKLITQTLNIFNKTNVYPNIRQVKLSKKDQKVLYMEEFLKENGIKKSYGFILIPKEIPSGKFKNISYYRKHLRLILDGSERMEKILTNINPEFGIDRWGANSEEQLNEIKLKLDNL